MSYSYVPNSAKGKFLQPPMTEVESWMQKTTPLGAEIPGDVHLNQWSPMGRPAWFSVQYSIQQNPILRVAPRGLHFR